MSTAKYLFQKKETPPAKKNVIEKKMFGKKIVILLEDEKEDFQKDLQKQPENEKNSNNISHTLCDVLHCSAWTKRYMVRLQYHQRCKRNKQR